MLLLLLKKLEKYLLQIHTFADSVIISAFFNPTAIMSEVKGHCHCGQTEWTVKIEDKAHVLW